MSRLGSQIVEGIMSMNHLDMNTPVKDLPVAIFFEIHEALLRQIKDEIHQTLCDIGRVVKDVGYRG